MSRLIGSLLRASACGAALMLAAPPVRGEPVPAPSVPPPPAERIVMRLDYNGVAGCSDSEPFTLALTPRVHGWDPLAPDAPFQLVITIKRRAPGYQGSADLYDRNGEVWSRSISPKARCLELLDTLAFVVAFHIDPPDAPPPAPAPALVPPAPEPPKPPPPPTEASKPLPAVASPTAPPAPVPAPRMWRFGAGVQVDLGLAPRPLVGLKLEAEVRREWFSVAGEFRWDPRASAIVRNSSMGFAVSTTLFTGGLVGCAHREWHASFAACVVGELGQIQRSSENTFSGGFQQGALYVAGGTGARVEIPLPARLYLHAAAELLGARKPAISSGNAGSMVSRGSVGGLTGGIGAGAGVSF
jgi:hypothetical protein